jgi:cell wall-associated NlpC family hydrolase/uncharacterized protein YukE
MNVGYPILEDASIPGDPDGLLAVGGQLRAAFEDIATVQERVAIDGLQGSWIGLAANRFRESLKELPGELGTFAHAFNAASTTVRDFAGQLDGFQSNARYYASRIETLEADLHSAQHRHTEAQAEVEGARLRESLATEPVSLKLAGEAVKDGLDRLRLALDDLEANRGEIERIRREAQNNRENYEAAVRAGCTALQDASTPTTPQSDAFRIEPIDIIAGVFSTLIQDIRNHLGNDHTPQATPSPAMPRATRNSTPVNPPAATPVVGMASVSVQANKAWAEHGLYQYTEHWPARENHGTLYGPGPRTMDCSAFAELCLKEAGIPDPSGKNYQPIGDTHTLIAGMEQVSSPEPGDLAFFGTPPADPDHVVVYVGNGESVGMEDYGLNMMRGSTEALGRNAGTFLGYWRAKT